MNVKIRAALFLGVFVLYEQVWVELRACVDGVYQ